MKSIVRQAGKWMAGGALTLALAGCGGSNVNVPGAQNPASTLAGGATAGNADGPLASASFNNPVNVATDAAGNIYVCDFDNGRVRRITTAGVVETIVNQANFNTPFGIAFMPDGRLFVQTDANDTGARDGTTGTIWRVDIAARTATVVARNLNGRPRGIVALNNSQLVLCDLTRSDVRLLNVNTGVVRPLAGSSGTAGFVNGQGIAARFSRPYGPAITPEGNILLADQNNHALRLVTPAGVVTTFAGNGTAGFRDGDRSQALFNAPQDVDIDAAGNIYVSDNSNHRIRRIRPTGQVETIAGDGTAGFRDGTGAQARFQGQEGIALRNNGATLVIADGGGGVGGPFNRVRLLTLR